MTLQNEIEQLGKFWYHAGEWHNAGCDFVCIDAGVCNCNLKKNKKELLTLIQDREKKAVEGFKDCLINATLNGGDTAVHVRVIGKVCEEYLESAKPTEKDDTPENKIQKPYWQTHDMLKEKIPCNSTDERSKE